MGGNPARFIRKRFDNETIQKLESLKWWDFNDEELKKFGSSVTDVITFLKK